MDSWWFTRRTRPTTVRGVARPIRAGGPTEALPMLDNEAMVDNGGRLWLTRAQRWWAAHFRRRARRTTSAPSGGW